MEEPQQLQPVSLTALRPAVRRERWDRPKDSFRTVGYPPSIKGKEIETAMSIDPYIDFWFSSDFKRPSERSAFPAQRDKDDPCMGSFVGRGNPANAQSPRRFAALGSL
jgi:hypothetical protein